MVRMLVPLSLAVMGTTVAGTASLRIMQNVNTGTSTSWILTSTLMIVFISTILALIAFSIFSQILIMYRYYTNLFTDEGYLTFTLPVKTTSILTSKVINAMIWSAYSLLIIFFCIFIYVAFGTAEGSHLINSEIFRELKDGIRILTETYSAGIIVKYIIEFLVFLFVSLLYGTISIYLALTIGSIIAKKHKILAAIGIYYGINMIMSLFITIINSIRLFRTCINLIVLQTLPPTKSSTSRFISTQLFSDLFGDLVSYHEAAAEKQAESFLISPCKSEIRGGRRKNFSARLFL